jgi:hypothetical protein
VFLGGEYLRYAQENKLDYDYPFENFKEELSKNDIQFFNLEGPIFEGSDVRKGVTSILSNHPAIIDFAKCAPICIANLANNHIMDYGAEGLLNTTNLLNVNNIFHAGAGKNIRDAGKEAVIECKNRKIGVLAYTDSEPHVGSVIAGENDAGSASFRNLNETENRIKELKSRTDLVIVSLHWGFEYFSYPSVDQVTIAHRLADAGSDLIIGHHPHVLQGVEEYKKSLIVYSLGNFFLPPVRMTNGRMEHRRKISQESIYLEVTVDASGSYKYYFKAGYVSKRYKIIKNDLIKSRRFDDKVNYLSDIFIDEKCDKYINRYYDIRKKQLERDNIIEAIKKLYKTPLPELIKTVSMQDIKINISRLIKYVTYNKNV